MNNAYAWLAPVNVIAYLYSLLFIIISTLYLHGKKDPFTAGGGSGPKQRLVYLAMILGSGFVLRLALAPLFPGFFYDMKYFMLWSTAAARNFTHVYVDPAIPANFGVNYPPLYLYFLFAIGKAISCFHLQNSPGWLWLVLKLPAMTADVATAYLLYRFAAKSWPGSISLLLAGSYLFNPAIIYDSVIWGQVDSLFVLFIGIGLVFISEKKFTRATVLITLSILMKPQALIILPVLFYELCRQKKAAGFLAAAKAVGLAFVAAVLTTGVVVIPFSYFRDPRWFFDLYFSFVGQFPFAAVNAFNLFALCGANFKPDTNTLFIFNYHTWGNLFILGIVGWVGILYWKCRRPEPGLPFLSAFILFSGVFVLSSQMHERYLFPALLFALFTYLTMRDRKIFYLYLLFSLTLLLNMAAVMQQLPGSNQALNFLIPASLGNVSAFLFLIIISIGILKPKSNAG